MKSTVGENPQLAERRHASTVLTPKQYEVWILHERGMSQRNIALALGVTKSTVVDHLTAARKNLADSRKDTTA